MRRVCKGRSSSPQLCRWLIVGVPADAQWLKHPTPNIPRTPDGKPNLSAPAPRGTDGHPDLSGPWTGRVIVIPVAADALTAESKALIQEREENYFKDRPAFQCQPSGPETVAGWRRIIQTPSLIAIAYETLTYRLIFMDGRKLEADPERTWMGYSVGRWEGDTLVVDSFGFNDRTWLDARGLPHTDALRTTERYLRRTFGQLQVELTVTDPGAFAKSWTATYDLQFQPDSEMVEGVCEDKTHWIGRLSEAERGAVTVPPQTLAKYVGRIADCGGRYRGPCGFSSKAGRCTRTAYSERECGSSRTPTRHSWAPTATPSTSIRRGIRRRSWWNGTCRATGSTRVNQRSAAQKYAVLCGGGQNYRIGLFDQVLIKENHIAAAGSLTAAVAAARRAAGSRKVEVDVEVETMEEFEEALRAGPDIIMLDEFSLADMRAAVALNNSKGHRVTVEASGSVTLETVRSVAETGVDYISIGGITKHVRAVELSMRLAFAS